jgi:hypothetical protein
VTSGSFTLLRIPRPPACPTVLYLTFIPSSLIAGFNLPLQPRAHRLTRRCPRRLNPLSRPSSPSTSCTYLPPIPVGAISDPAFSVPPNHPPPQPRYFRPLINLRPSQPCGTPICNCTSKSRSLAFHSISQCEWIELCALALVVLQPPAQPLRQRLQLCLCRTEFLPVVSMTR